MQQHNLNQQQPQLSFYQQNMASPYGKPSSCFWDSSLEKHEQRQQPMFSRCASVLRRNARERNRVKQLNNGFSLLRQQIPVAIIAELSNGRRGIGRGANKMLSKVNILRMAVEYIRRLQRTIDENDQKQQQQLHLQQQQQQQQQQLHSQQQQQQQQQQLHWQQQPQQPTHQQQQHCNYQQQFHQQQQQQSYALQHQWQLNSSSGSCNSTTSNTSSSSASALPSCCYHM